MLPKITLVLCCIVLIASLLWGLVHVAVIYFSPIMKDAVDIGHVHASEGAELVVKNGELKLTNVGSLSVGHRRTFISQIDSVFLVLLSIICCLSIFSIRSLQKAKESV